MTIDGHRISPDQLRKIGEALYGDRWQSALAHALGVGDRRVREWLAEERRIPIGVVDELANLAEMRGKKLLAVAAEIAIPPTAKIS